MSDTPERLRKMADVRSSRLYSQRKVLNEAADEIERLQDQAGQLADALEGALPVLKDAIPNFDQVAEDPELQAIAQCRYDDAVAALSLEVDSDE